MKRISVRHVLLSVLALAACAAMFIASTAAIGHGPAIVATDDTKGGTGG